MKLKPKPIIKTNQTLYKISNWIVEKFPENYKELSYFEPFFNDGSILLSKEKSIEEVVSSSDLSLINIWRAIRDECTSFSSKIKRMTYSKNTFEKCQKINHEDYMDEAIKEFVLRRMSKEGLKKTYISLKTEIKCKDCWCDLFEEIPIVSERIQDLFFINMNDLESVKSFNHSKSLIFCSPPLLDSENADFHTDLSVLLRDFRGKVVLYGRNSTLYKRLFPEWHKKGIPENRNLSIWSNF